MLAHLRRSFRPLHCLPNTVLASSDPASAFAFAFYSVCSSHFEASSFASSWYTRHAARDFSTKANNRDATGRGYQHREFKPTTPVKDDDAIIDRIQNSMKESKQGPVGKNLSSAEKKKFLVNTFFDLDDSKEAVYNTLDAWVAFEQDFPVALIKQALQALEKEEQWHRIVQVIKWMLSKGQGNTIKTYEQLVCALEKDNRAEEACRIWEDKIATQDLRSVPWNFCNLMFGIYYRNNKLDMLIKLFKNLEACGRKFRSKDIFRKVEDAYEMLGLTEEKKEMLEKYKDLYNMPPSIANMKVWQLKKAEEKAKSGSNVAPATVS
ncbi:hypothetical protein GUJ93_ZPchr0009g1123 [Zizania palustris]|uniref:Uncharacterized protein n=1 Tax=Zizania palustris TaxID=103762 RepID=A0A8J5RNJ5_ZIZPA|nr:hypothetical protein GUJ93_ZPchr0009g1123 [Zizania palustris]